MTATIILNIVFFLIFVTFQIHYYTQLNYYESKFIQSISPFIEQDHRGFRDWSITADVFFFLTMVFYFMACLIEPGYVR